MRYFILTCALALTACTAPNTADNTNTPTTPKPTLDVEQPVCTMEYMPVCATLEQNGQQFTKTFGNRCSAHSFIPKDTKVIKVDNGACE
ncbi:hypothetical protein [Moraxella equi]|uniref:Kazal-like domain-containing protein n=1 Tax=Moraxella equi TaxID=60442 RepID=A0A378QV07_9GAMM|nr:hypothetical protein [Moraxella equi]OPH38973.1 hypothetical protein B5J93_04795 [Moraxella equi]STZ04695.1 Uncharacterised protein [Moraxella equi]